MSLKKLVNWPISVGPTIDVRSNGTRSRSGTTEHAVFDRVSWYARNAATSLSEHVVLGSIADGSSRANSSTRLVRLRIPHVAWAGSSRCPPVGQLRQGRARRASDLATIAQQCRLGELTQDVRRRWIS